MIKKVLVTGDRGYIGSVLVPVLLTHGCEVIGYDAAYFTTEKNTLKRKNGYTQITKDIRNIEEKDIKGVDAIIHLSALSNDPMGDIDSKLTKDINTVATLKLVELAKKNNVKRFLFSSSCSVYGIAKHGIVDEKSIATPLTEYAKSKVTVEKALQKTKDKNFCIGILRNATVYGYSPNFRSDLVVNNLVCAAIAQKKIKVLSDGTPWRPLIDVRDLADIFYEFLTVMPENINGEIINIGFNENNIQVKDIVTTVSKEFPECEIVYTGEHGNDTRSYQVNFNKFRTLFPNIKQKWTIGQSIHDLKVKLEKIPFSDENSHNENFIRLNKLKQLLSENKVNKDLFWNIVP